jgi:hypothetical protein
MLNKEYTKVKSKIVSLLVERLIVPQFFSAYGPLKVQKNIYENRYATTGFIKKLTPHKIALL